jgi:hypothetical protein
VTLSQFLLKHGIELLQWEQGLVALLLATTGVIPLSYIKWLMLANVVLTYTIDFINKQKESGK